MPNVKLYVDETVHARHSAALKTMLTPLRTLLCERLTVPVAACQLAAMPVIGLSDQPLINIELLVLPHPDRTSALFHALGQEIRDIVAEATGVRCAVRFSLLDKETYVALK